MDKLEIVTSYKSILWEYIESVGHDYVSGRDNGSVGQYSFTIYDDHCPVD